MSGKPPVSVPWGRKASIGLLGLVLALIACPVPTQSAGRRDPQTGRIKVLYVGEPVGSSPYPALESDPLIEPYPVQASAVVFSFSIAKRSIRQYMPRTYADLSSFQVFILSDANAAVFSANQLRWFTWSVKNNGSGLVMVGGNEAFGACCGHLSWGTTPVQDVLPVECIPMSGQAGAWTY